MKEVTRTYIAGQASSGQREGVEVYVLGDVVRSIGSSPHGRSM